MGDRDPAAPLLTLYDGPARVELSGATTANWVAKSANLLVDGYGSPDRIGLLLSLHWQSVALLLAGVATGASVVVAADVAGLVGTTLVFTHPSHAEQAVALPVDDVLVVSSHPFGTSAGESVAGTYDFAQEVPGYGDHWSGSGRPPGPVELAPAGPVDVSLLAAEYGLGAADRVLTTAAFCDRVGLPLGILAPLAAGANLVLVPSAGLREVTAHAAAEGVTATVGVSLPGIRRLDAGHLDAGHLDAGLPTPPHRQRQ